MLQAYLIYFDSEIMKVQAEVLQLHNVRNEVARLLEFEEVNNI